MKRVGIWLQTAMGRLFLGSSISLACFYFAFRNSSVEQLYTTLIQAVPVYIGLALISVVVNICAKALRWQTLLGTAGNQISFGRYLAALLIGQMLNILIPARIGDVSRIYTLGPIPAGRIAIAGSIVLEKILDLIFYAGVCCLFILFMPLPSWLYHSIILFLLLGALAGSSLLLWRSSHIRTQLKNWLQTVSQRIKFLQRFEKRLATLVNHLGKVHQQQHIWMLLLLSGGIWLTALLNNYFVLQAFQLQLPFTAAIAVLVVLQAGVSIPSLPGTIGVFEALCVATLSLFDIPQTQALSYGIVLHVLVFVPPIMAGVICIWVGQFNFPKSMSQ